MSKKSVFLMSVFTLCLGSFSWAGDINFDQKMDIQKVTGDVKAASKDFPIGSYYGDPYYHPGYGDPYYDPYNNGNYHGGGSGHYIRNHHVTMDCQDIYTRGSQMESGRVMLTSREYVEDCYIYPAPTQQNPNATEERCYEREIGYFSRSAQVVFRGQKDMRPWETEKFKACLNGPAMDLSIRIPAYDYGQYLSGGGNDMVYVLEPRGAKKLMDPDPEGLYSTVFTRNGNSFKVVLNDRWADAYKGEKITIKVQLKKSKGNTDSLFKEQVFEFNTAAQYEINFNSDIKAGKFYVRWDLQRSGSVVSNQNMIAGRQTEFMEIQ